MSTSHEPSTHDLANIKARLKGGKLETADFAAIKSLVERTEQAAKNLRAAIVE